MPIFGTHPTDIEVNKTSKPFRRVRQALLQSHTKCREMITTPVSGIHPFEPEILVEARELTIPTHCVTDVVPSRPFQILISNFFEKAMHLPKHMVVAFAMVLPASVMTASTTLTHEPPMGAPENLDHSALRDEHSAYCKAEHNTALSKALKAKHDIVHNLVEAVHFKLRTDRESQIDQQKRQKQDPTAQLKKNWRREVAISAQYHSYQKPFINKLSKF